MTTQLQAPSPVARAKRRARAPLNVILAQPRGFCAGVVRAIDLVERELERHGDPIYVLHEIVHNRHVVEDLRRRGARFVESLDLVPDGERVVFSAHGVSRAIVNGAAARRLAAVDGTCPLVTRVHQQGQKYLDQGYELILIGHAGHPEVVGTLGQLDGTVHLVGDAAAARRIEVGNAEKVAYITQTTLGVDDTRQIIEVLRERFPGLRGPDVRDICYATQNRQTAVKALGRQVDLVLVLGSANSSNSNRLVEVARATGCRAERIENAAELHSEWLDGVRTLGITAGASAPEVLVEELVERLRTLRDLTLSTAAGPEEKVVFQLPA